MQVITANKDLYTKYFGLILIKRFCWEDHIYFEFIIHKILCVGLELITHHKKLRAKEEEKKFYLIIVDRYTLFLQISNQIFFILLKYYIDINFVVMII